MRVKLLVALGAGALLLAACGGQGSDAPAAEATPPETTAPTAEDAAKEAAAAADAPPEAPAEATEPAVNPGETPQPPEPTKSENIFY